MNLTHAFREARDLGVRRTLFRLTWEARLRSGAMRLFAPRAPHYDAAWSDPGALPFGDPGVAASASPAAVVNQAEDAAHGRILCFGKWIADFGDPIDWHRDPITGERWPAGEHWSTIPLDGRSDIKFVWEAGRFSHAYLLARASAHEPRRAAAFGAALLAQIDDFVAKNPFGVGVHWASGYEIALRSFAWTFALHVFTAMDVWDEAARQRVLAAIFASAVHVASFLDFARLSCDNDHLVGESLLLLIASCLFPHAPQAADWRETAIGILDQQAAAQIDESGAYFMASHVYHRAVLQMYALAVAFHGPREPWIAALRRSHDFLASQQNPIDGRLPNLGSNDGGVPFIGSSCDPNDFRPVLQSISAIACGERLYDDGPWDEEMLWMGGSRSLPLHPPKLVSRSFQPSGYHVLRGNDPSTFAVFRCGPVTTRFPQIDMLHLDVWWRGRNVLADAGTYRYNAASEWHEHFVRTASHNTLTIDGQDQMLHYRPFKMLYWTDARLLRFETSERFDLMVGEHYGYRRIGCTHRRSVLFAKDDLWIVADHVTGEGEHDLRLQWLRGDDAPFVVSVFDGAAQRLEPTVVAGATSPPRGWLSRYYGEKVAVPSIAVERRGALPFTFVSVLAPAPIEIAKDGERWTAGDLSFTLRDGTIVEVA